MTWGDYTIRISEETRRAIAEIAEGFNLSTVELLDSLASGKLTAIDLSCMDETIIKIKRELCFLQWTNEKLEFYLMIVYRKKDIELLNDREIFEFLDYLQKLKLEIETKKNVSEEQEEIQDFLDSIHHVNEEREEYWNIPNLIYEISIDLHCLKLTANKLKKILIARYGKRNIEILTRRELFDFLQYLNNQLRSNQSSWEISYQDLDKIRFSSILRKIDMDMNFLGCTQAKKKTFLFERYKKDSIQELSSEEIDDCSQYLDYLKSQQTAMQECYLSSLPSFSEILDSIDRESSLLDWTREKEYEYLMSRYGRRSRESLTYKELSDFLEYLRSQPTPPKKD